MEVALLPALSANKITSRREMLPMSIPLCFSFTVLLFILSFERGDAYHSRQSFIKQISKPAISVAMVSTVQSTTDNLATAVYESGKDVVKLKFEPIFKSFAQNEYFVSDSYNEVAL